MARPARRRRGFRFTLWHVALGAAIVLLPMLPHFFAWLELQLPLRTTPLVREAIQRVAEDPRVVSALGHPVHAGWSVMGYIRSDETGWSEGRLWIPLSGPKGEATLYARAGRGTGPWVFTDLECRVTHGATINFLNVPSASLNAAPRGAVYLVHLGAVREVSIDRFRDYYREHLGLRVNTLPPISVDPNAFNAWRRQFVAERVIESMTRSLPNIAADSSATVIGVLEDDMYIAGVSWNWAFGYRGNTGFAVVSTARMEPALNSILKRDALLYTRARKMITKDIGILAYNLPLNNDPTSLLYGGVMGLDDLDLIQERFDGLGQLAEISPTVVSHLEKAVPPQIRAHTGGSTGTGRYPCFVVRPGAGWDGVSPIDARVTECLPGLRAERAFDEFEVNLEWGFLVTRQTDLFRPDQLPLALTRCYRQFDPFSRSFGIGGNHPYDILPTGSRNPYTYVDLIMPDGSPIHYDRISEGTGYADAWYEHTATATPFLHSQFRWNGDGWDLKFADGGLFVFPENYAGTRANQGAPTEMRDGAGHVIRFTRDRDRNLEQITSSSGRFIRFDHDASSRVTLATSDEGRQVRYTYDAGGRLATVTSPDRVIEYRYIDTDLVSIRVGPRQLLRVQRDDARRVSEIALADGRVFRFRFVGGNAADGRAEEAIVEGPGTAPIHVPTGGSK